MLFVIEFVCPFFFYYYCFFAECFFYVCSDIRGLRKRHPVSYAVQLTYTGRKNGFASNLLSANMMQICANWGINLIMSKRGEQRFCTD